MQTKYFQETDAMLSQAIGIAQMIAVAKTGENFIECVSDAGWCVADLLSAIQEIHRNSSQAVSEAHIAEKKALEEGRENVTRYFDPATSAADRLALEGSITDDDIEAMQRSISHGQKTWDTMQKQESERLDLVKKLKAKRMEATA